VKGFTLLEVVIALAIAAGVLLTVISSVNYHLSIIGDSREETTAALLARAKLEDPDFSKQTATNGDFAPEHPELKWQVEILPADIPLLSRKRLTVSWGESGQHKVALVQYVPKQ
jgi:general secretion pathway protein I